MYDNVCKFLAENFATDLAQWLLNEPVDLTVLEPTELQVDPIRADSLIFLESPNLILHIEFQTTPKDDVPFRMADYRLRLYRRYPNKRIYQVVIYLRQTNSPLVKQDSFEIPELVSRYNVIRLWEVPSQQLLSKPGLLPFAVLSQPQDAVNVLTEVAKQIEGIEDKQIQSNLAATSAILAGLVLDKIVIKRLLREEIMKESVMYQEIRSEGKAEGFAEGLQQGKQQGIEQEANLIVIRLLNRRLGQIPQDLTRQVSNLSLEQLENLGEALLDFTTEADLINWLNQCQFS